MTKEQVGNWIVEHIKKNSELAKEYKELRLSRLNMELKDTEAAFNRKGYLSYMNPEFSRSIKENQDSIKKIESKTDDELLIEDFVSHYGESKPIEDLINYIKSLTDEDHYIEGVFKNTKYYYISCQEDFEHQLDTYTRCFTAPEFDDKTKRKYKKELEEIKETYKNGLSKRDEFIKKGEKSHQELLAEEEEYLRQYEDIDKRGPEIIQKLIDEELKLKKHHCRRLAQISVVDAFNAMGAHPNPKQEEQIDEIIEMHDPSVVESAIQSMLANPTKNMLALAKNIKETPAQSRQGLKVMKAVDIFSLAVGGILTTMGIVGTAMGNPSLLTTTVLGLGNLGLGFTGMRRHTRKTNNLDEKETLISNCIQDFLDEVVFQETFDKGLQK